MKPKTQIVVLIVMLAILGVTAYVVLAPKGAARTQAVGPKVQETQADAVAIALPTEEEIATLKGWLASPKSDLPARPLPTDALSGAASASGSPTAALPPPEPIDPMRLYGIVRSPDSVAVVIGENTYRVGERLSGQPFTVARIDTENSQVLLKSEDGKDKVLDLLK